MDQFIKITGPKLEAKISDLPYHFSNSWFVPKENFRGVGLVYERTQGNLTSIYILVHFVENQSEPAIMAGLLTNVTIESGRKAISDYYDLICQQLVSQNANSVLAISFQSFD